MNTSAEPLKSAGLCLASFAFLTQVNAFTPTSETRLEPEQPESFAQFGAAVASSPDTLVIGEPLAYTQGMPMAGSVSVYTRTDTDWLFDGKLLPNPPNMMACFGGAVAVDADTLVVGAPTENTGWGEGAVYVFQRSTTGWGTPVKLLPADPSPGQSFGDQVAVEGETIVVGAKGEDRPWSDSGAVYIFSAAGGSWTQIAKLQPPLPAAGDYFGAAVAIENGRIVVGCPYRDAVLADTGALFFLTQQAGLWSIESEWNSSPTSELIHLGWSVDFDGNTVVAGAPALDQAATRENRVWVLTESPTGWVETAVLSADDPQPSSLFGSQVRVKDQLVAVGAPGDDTFAPSAGSVYIFEAQGNVWAQTSEIGASDATIGSQFGNALTLSEGMLVVGANYHSAQDSFYSGAAYAITYETDAPQNQTPIADASATNPEAAAPRDGTAVVTLDGSLSNDPDGDLLTYTWSDGQTLLGSGIQLLVRIPVGEHTLRLTVDDGQSQASTTVTIQVTALNSPPVADAGATAPRMIAAVRIGAQLELDATRSYDPDGDALTYQWWLQQSEVGNAPRVSFGAGVGTHTFQLAVSDGIDEDRTSCTVEVITPGAATWELIQHTAEANLSRQTACLGVRLLRVTARLFDRGESAVACRILRVYQCIIQHRPGNNTDTAEIAKLVAEAQRITDAMSAK